LSAECVRGDHDAPPQARSYLWRIWKIQGLLWRFGCINLMEASPPAQRNDAMMRTPRCRPTPELECLSSDGVSSGLSTVDLETREEYRRFFSIDTVKSNC
jgi:hypothetical protein